MVPAGDLRSAVREIWCTDLQCTLPTDRDFTFRRLVPCFYVGDKIPQRMCCGCTYLCHKLSLFEEMVPKYLLIDETVGSSGGRQVGKVDPPRVD